MPFSLNLRSDNETAQAIVALWDRISAFEGRASMRALNYPPHFTFAIYDLEDVHEEQVTTALQRVAEGRSQVSITFDSIRTFTGVALILWADPEPKEALLQMHQIVHSAIDPRLCRSHYRPGNWVPHCTLATRIRKDRHEDALAFVERFRGGIKVIFDVVDCVAIPSLRRSAEIKLPAATDRT